MSPDPQPTAPEAPPAVRTHYRRLFLVGFAVLLLELACIRWFAAFVVFLQFFANVVMVGAFLGFSLGCLRPSASFRFLRSTPGALLSSVIAAILVFYAYYAWSGITLDVGSVKSGSVVFFGTESRRVDLAQFVVPIEVTIGFFFVMITLSFVGLGEVFGASLEAAPNRVTAYISNILGSLAGTGAFYLLSRAETFPSTWFAIGLGITATLMWELGILSGIRVMKLLAILLLIAGSERSWRPTQQIFWSPYYAVRYLPEHRAINVNTMTHQAMHPRDQSGAAYSLIHLLRRDSGDKPFRRALVIGAGSGNDVSHALGHGIEHLDAVEIDPRINALGRRHHPDQPFADPRVTIHLDDGRHFMRNATEPYDLIVYALVDSLLLSSSYSSLRLESFLFTREAFRDARRLLAPDGVFVIYNLFRQGWIVQRIIDMLRAEVGGEPIVLSMPGMEVLDTSQPLDDKQTIIIAGDTARIASALETHGGFLIHDNPELNRAINGFEHREPLAGSAAERLPLTTVTGEKTFADLATDDWPFLYLQTPSLPLRPYVTSLIVIALISFLLVRGFSGRLIMSRPGIAMFALGAGFLLLQSKAVVQLSLIFGSTWVVNSAVFAGILVVILASNLLVLRRPPATLLWPFAGLFLSILAAFFLPLDVFLSGPEWWRFGASTGFTLLPLFFSGVLFSSLLRSSSDPRAQFGMNVLGSVFGAGTEYLSMLVGFRGLLIAAAVLYAVAAAASARGSSYR